MNIALRLALTLGSFVLLYIIIRKVSRAKIAIADSIFWLILSALLIFCALFPQAIRFCATLFGFEATSNFVFVAVIGIVLIKQFNNSVEISRLKYKVEQLSQEIALQQKTDQTDES